MPRFDRWSFVGMSMCGLAGLSGEMRHVLAEKSSTRRPRAVW